MSSSQTDDSPMMPSLEMFDMPYTEVEYPDEDEDDFEDPEEDEEA